MTSSPWSSFGGSDGWLNLVHRFAGSDLAQTYSALYWLGRCFEEHPQIKSVLELGTLYGSLSSFFGLSFPGRVMTCDHVDRRKDHARALHDRLGVRFELADVLDPASPPGLLDKARRDGPLFLFCDNGGKEKEFLQFSPHLRPGDVVAVHDFRTEFNPDRLEIADLIKRLGLKPWRQQELDADGAFIGVWEVPAAVADAEPVKPRYRLHVQGMPHTATGAPEFHHCAFTKNIRDFCKMMTGLGHEVIHYGGEGSIGDFEHVQLVSRAERADWFKSDWKKTQSDVEYDASRPYWREFNNRTIEAIKARISERDFICLVGGANRPVVDAFPGHHTVEFAVGYAGTVARFRCFASYAWMHFVYGLQRQMDGKWIEDVVIPHYLDPAEFPFDADARERARTADHCLYLGRALLRKGPSAAAEVCKRSGLRLVLAGQGFEVQKNHPDPRRITSNISTEGGLLIEGDHASFVGSANPEQRATLLANCRALMCPTIYVGPFELVHAEAQMCGVPVICTDWGAFAEGIVNGVTGFRVRTMAEAVYAAKHAGDLDPRAIREHAMRRWSLEAVAPQYQRWFDRMYSLWGEGWYAPGEMAVIGA